MDAVHSSGAVAIDVATGAIGLIPEIHYTVVEEIDFPGSCNEHFHMVIDTEGYGRLRVCSLKGDWLVMPEV